MDLKTQQVRVALGGDEDGALLFQADRLVALLVRLSSSNEIAPNCWYLEASFDEAVSSGSISPSLDQAVASIRKQLDGAKA